MSAATRVKTESEIERTRATLPNCGPEKKIRESFRANIMFIVLHGWACCVLACVCARVCRSSAANANTHTCSNWIWMICSRLPSVWQHVAAIAGNRCRVFIFYAATGGSVSEYASHVNTIDCIVHNQCSSTLTHTSFLTHKCNLIVIGSMCLCVDAVAMRTVYNYERTLKEAKQ